MNECPFLTCPIQELYRERHELKDQRLNHAIAIVQGPNDLDFAESHNRQISTLQEEIERVTLEINRLAQQIVDQTTCPECIFVTTIQIENGVGV